jgi:hypothetical protein
MVSRDTSTGFVGLEMSSTMRVQRVPYVENKGSPREVVVGKQKTPFGHHVFGVVYLHAHLVGHGGRNEMSVGGRRWICVDDGEEIVTLTGHVSGPSE